MRDDLTFDLNPFNNSKYKKMKARRFGKGYDALDRVNYILNEVYKKSDTQFIKDYVDQIEKVFNNEADSETLRPYLIKYRRVTRIDLTLRETYADYDDMNDVITVYLNRADFSKKQIINRIRELYVHEDTHRQQINKNLLSKVVINNFDKLLFDPWDLKDPKNVAYYNQVEEADAYGRQIGEKLRVLYPEKDSEEILELVFDNRVDTYTKYMEELKVYRDQRIKKKARQHFFRALYDYLSEQEGENSLKALWENVRICAFQDFNVATAR